jgi:hypothetical protein
MPLGPPGPRLEQAGGIGWPFWRRTHPAIEQKGGGTIVAKLGRKLPVEYCMTLPVPPIQRVVRHGQDAVIQKREGQCTGHFLFQTEPNDPRILIGALLTQLIVGLIASAVPARRAAAVDPLTALRQG